MHVRYSSTGLLPPKCDLQNLHKNPDVRLDGVLDRIIDRCESSFMEGRNIMDNIMNLHEILHDTKVKRKSGLVLKLDFEKAYDMISWTFLFDCLKQRGFSEKLCRWIKELV